MKTKLTKDHLLNEAIRLLKERGAHGFSYQDLSLAVGIRKASIHYYFPHKEDLLLAVVKFYREELSAYLKEGKSLKPYEKVKYLALLYRKVLEGDAQRFCPCGSLAAEWMTISKKLQEAVQQFFKDQEEWLGMGEESDSVIARLQGTLLMARLSKNPLDFFDNQVKLL